MNQSKNTDLNRQGLHSTTRRDFLGATSVAFTPDEI